ncbi:MAG: hypothetical protein B6244_13110 [Candidatus Cloacimonetes bacterium 4572_55]|nr:MAG: hypothetical protein B6244_13110 [Candidatus Cloacimonetes bacterium 4572_55]
MPIIETAALLGAGGYIFGNIILPAIVNISSEPAGEILEEKILAHFRKRNHDIQRGMENAFKDAINDIAKSWIEKNPDCGKKDVETYAKILIEDKKRILFGTGDLGNQQAYNLLLPDSQSLTSMKSQANKMLTDQIKTCWKHAPPGLDSLKKQMENELLPGIIFQFRQQFKKDETIFRTIVVDFLSDIRDQIENISQTTPSIDIPGLTETILKGMGKYCEIWTATNEDTTRLLNEFAEWKGTVSDQFRGLTDLISEMTREVKDKVDEKGDEVIHEIKEDLSNRFQELQNATEEQNAALQREIQRLQEKRIQEDRLRQKSGNKSVGLKPAVDKCFVDREIYLENLTKKASDPHSRLILIVGQGGIGKTQLAARFCDDIEKASYKLRLKESDSLPIRAIVFVNKREMIRFSMDQLLEKLAKTLDTSDLEDLTPLLKDPNMEMIEKTDALLERLQGDPVLLVLDNFESALDQTQISFPDLEEFIERVCGTDHSLKLILTSRRNVELDAMEGFDKPMHLDKGLDPEYAIEFMRKLGRGKVRQLKKADDASLGKLSEKVYGVPMALRALVSFLKNKKRLTVERLLADEKRFADFTKFDSQKGLNKMIGEQYESLPTDHRLVLQVLAIYNQPTEPVAISWLLPAVDAGEIGDSLYYDYFLAQYDDIRERFGLHPSVREFVYNQIPLNSDATDETNFTRDAMHARAADFHANLKKPESEWKELVDLDPHLDEFRQRVLASQYERAARILNAIDFDYLQLWGHSLLVVELREGLLGKLTDPDLKQINLGNLGTTYYRTGRVRESIGYYEQALTIARESEDKQGEGAWLENLGNLYHHQAISEEDSGLLTRAQALYQEAISLDQPPSHYSCCFFLGLAFCRQSPSDRDQVLSFLQRSITLSSDHHGYSTAYRSALAQYALSYLKEESLEPSLSAFRSAYQMCHVPGVLNDVRKDILLIKAAGIPVEPLDEVHPTPK